MENLKCNVCSKQVQSKFQLETLREIYQTEDIVQVCEDCLYIINKQLDKLQRKCWNRKLEVENISTKLKDYILQMKG